MKSSRPNFLDKARIAGLTALFLAYAAFTFSPFLNLHSHFADGHDGFHSVTNHSHALSHEAHADHGGTIWSLAQGDIGLGESSGRHQGLEGSTWCQPSVKFIFAANLLSKAPGWVKLAAPPKPPASQPPVPIPISPGPYPDDVPAFLFGNLPPPSVT